MILTASDAIEGLSHLVKPINREPDELVVVLNEGKRYGPFRDEGHAGFFIKHMKWRETATIRWIPNDMGYVFPKATAD